MKNLIAALTVLGASTLLSPTVQAASETAVLAGGCFWCVEKDMDHVKGVISTTSGYAGGTAKNPTYENHEGYTEAVKVVFDPEVISYGALVAHFLRTIDVVDGGGQFCDRGPSYIPALVPLNQKQAKEASEALVDAGEALGQKIAVRVIETPSFADAENYHQDYYKGQNRVVTRFGLIKQSDAYARYRKACGRDMRVKKLWGDAAYSFPAGGGES
jgi:peptide-methionine (S)-S-oxide reductase